LPYAKTLDELSKVTAPLGIDIVIVDDK